MSIAIACEGGVSNWRASANMTPTANATCPTIETAIAARMRCFGSIGLDDVLAAVLPHNAWIHHGAGSFLPYHAAHFDPMLHVTVVSLCVSLADIDPIRHWHSMTQSDSQPAAPRQQTKPLEESLLDVLGRAGEGTLSPPEIAHLIIPDGDWHALLMPIRRAAVKLALEGRLVIYRKGKPVDPNDFRGVYRLGLPRNED